MPRQVRLDIPGALHHIMVRGINKADIFRDDQDGVNFLQRLRGRAGLEKLDSDISDNAALN